MMKHKFIGIRSTAIRTFIAGFAVLALLAFVLPQAVQASTAANTVIRNTVTVNFKDTANNAMTAVTGTVDITVAYVYATPTLNAPADQNTIPGTAVVYNYTITSGANGNDTYALTAAAPTEARISGSTAVFSPTSVTLGATSIVTAVTIAAAGTTAITVPNDGATDASINGLIAGATVVINGAVYTIASITDNGGTVGGTSTVTVNGNTTASGSLPVGTLIEERKTFTMTVTPGTVSAGAIVDPTITVTASAKGTTAAAATDVTVTTVNIAKLTVVKEVSPDGTTWYTTASAPKFAPGATVWYRITVTNGGSSNATAVTATDPVPTYTTYVGSSTLLNGKTVTGDSATSPLIAGLVIDDDNPARTAGALASGTLHAAGVGIVIYKVTVNN